RRLRGEVDTLVREVRTLEAENERLSRVIVELQEDPAVIERIAREELGLVRPGERVLRFPRSARPAEPAPPSSPPRPPQVAADRTLPRRPMRWAWLQPYTGWLFLATLLFNLRAAWKLAIDWAGMRTTVRFVQAGYARRVELPSEEALEREARAPVFLTLVAAYQEPGIAATMRGPLARRYPGERGRYAVVTKAAEDAAPHPAMPASTGMLCQQFLGDLPPYDAKRLAHLVLPGPGR